MRTIASIEYAISRVAIYPSAAKEEGYNDQGLYECSGTHDELCWRV
jgi:hypothetical protein